MNSRTSIHIGSKDRHAELALLLQSLRTQSYQDWDLVIYDQSQTPLLQCHFLANLINRIELEGHYVNIFRDEPAFGVCHARNKLIEKDYFENEYVCRLDDDVILEKDYLNSLIDVIIEGYDIASGVTPLLGTAEFVRSVNAVKPVINKKEFDAEGNIIKYGDDCGSSYDDSQILPAHEFRSNALMKRIVAEQIKYPTNLSPTGFREEAFYSFKALTAGFKIGVDTGAKAYHLCSPSGGVRAPDYAERVKSDDEYFRKWAKELYLKHKEVFK